MTGSPQFPMPEPPAPGWYHDGVAMRWWTGSSWGPYSPAGPATSTPPHAVAGATTSVLSHVGFFFFAVFMPLIIRQSEGKKDPFVRHHSTEALNFQLTFLAAWLSGFVAIITVAASTSTSDGSVSGFIALPFLVMFVLFAAGAGMSIVGAIRASRGEWWRYPISIRFVRGARARTK